MFSVIIDGASASAPALIGDKLMPFTPANYKSSFEKYAAIYADDDNADFLESAADYISVKIDRPLDDADMTNKSVKQALFRLALYYYQNRDFFRPALFDALAEHIDGLLAQAGLLKPGRNIPTE